MKNGIRNTIVIGFILLVLHAHARPTITLMVTLDEITFRSKYNNNIPDIENLLAAKFAEHLNIQIPVFEFKTSGVSPDTLHIALVKVGTGLLYDANFRLQIFGTGFNGMPKIIDLELAKNVKYSTILYKDRYEDFVDVVVEIFRNQFSLRSQDIIDNQLGHILIKEQLTGPHSPGTEKGWTLPYTHRQLGIYDPTEFKVRQVFQDSTISNFKGVVRSFSPTSRIRIRAMDGPGYDNISVLNRPVLYVDGMQLVRINRVTSSSTISSTME